MECWRSKQSIWQDLSLAQGREVPVDIENIVGYNEKPPALICTEETEEEFFENCVGDGDYSNEPDIGLIQEMLNKVRHVDIRNIEENGQSKINNVKTNYSCGKTLSQSSEKSGKHIEEIKRVKSRRNVAVASLIDAYGNGADKSENQQTSLGLLRPENFVSNIQKSNNQETNISTMLQSHDKAPVLISPINMFKKKSIENKNPILPNISQSSNIAKLHNGETSIGQPKMFIPSSNTKEMYEQYKKRSESQEKVQIREDIWSKAERQMKEIEAKKKQEQVSLQTSDDYKNANLVKIFKHWDLVCLPQHRHLLTEDCAVCKVMCKK